MHACACRGRPAAAARPVPFPAARLARAALAAALTAALAVLACIPGPAAGASTIEELEAYLRQELAAASSIEEELAAALASELAVSAEGIGPGSGGTGIYGDCATTGGMLAEQTLIDFWKANITAIGELAVSLDTANYNTGSVMAAVREYGVTRDRALEGLSKSLQETLASGTAVLRRAMLARDHDPGDGRLGCADLRSAVAEMVAGAGMAGFGAGQKLALESLGDATAEDFADALHRKEHEMLLSDAMAGVSSFEARWLINGSDFVVGGDDQVRQTFLIDALASPFPAPKVPESVEGTASGLAARAAILRGSAPAGVAGAALRRIAALHAPQPALADAVEELEEQAGSGDRLTPAAGDDGEGYSWMQLVEARRRFLVGPNLLEDFGAAGEGDGAAALNAASAVEVNRRVYRTLAAEFSLALESFRGELHDTVLLAALAGGEGRTANARIAAFFSSPRQ